MRGAVVWMLVSASRLSAHVKPSIKDPPSVVGFHLLLCPNNPGWGTCDQDGPCGAHVCQLSHWNRLSCGSWAASGSLPV